MADLYLYRLRGVSVLDGDTVRADLDLGFGIILHARVFRFAGVDAPEKDTPAGQSARESLLALLSQRDEIIVRTEKDKLGLYNRILGTLFVRDGDGELLDVTAHGLENGWLRPYPGRGPHPWSREGK